MRPRFLLSDIAIKKLVLNEFEYEWMSSVGRSRAGVRTTESYWEEMIVLTKSLTSVTARTDWHVN